MTRLRGRAPRGQRVHGSAPHGHWHVTTLLGALRLDGSTACLAVEGATDAEIFATYVREVLGPTLKRGDVVIMDNLPPHQDAASLEIIAQRGAAVRFLPAYSPDLNPIEKMWSKVKGVLRSLEARTQPALHQAIGQALSKITPQDAMNWFASCGYSFL